MHIHVHALHVSYTYSFLLFFIPLIGISGMAWALCAVLLVTLSVLVLSQGENQHSGVPQYQRLPDATYSYDDFAPDHEITEQKINDIKAELDGIDPASFQTLSPEQRSEIENLGLVWDNKAQIQAELRKLEEEFHHSNSMTTSSENDLMDIEDTINIVESPRSVSHSGMGTQQGPSNTGRKQRKYPKKGAEQRMNDRKIAGKQQKARLKGAARQTIPNGEQHIISNIDRSLITFDGPCHGMSKFC